MADPSERISQLKIDRTADAKAGRNWLWPTIAVVIVAAGGLWLFVLRPSAAGVVGGLFPAIRAARLPVAQALREL